MQGRTPLAELDGGPIYPLVLYHRPMHVYSVQTGLTFEVAAAFHSGGAYF